MAAARGVLASCCAAGACRALAGAAPLSCAEGIEPSCTLTRTRLDVVHATATVGEIVATVLAFALIGLGLLPARPLAGGGPRQPGDRRPVWLVLTALTGVSYLSGDVDEIKGALQRGDQLLFGAWLALLGIWASRGNEDPTSDGEMVGGSAGQDLLREDAG